MLHRACNDAAHPTRRASGETPPSLSPLPLLAVNDCTPRTRMPFVNLSGAAFTTCINKPLSLSLSLAPSLPATDVICQKFVECAPPTLPESVERFSRVEVCSTLGGLGVKFTPEFNVLTEVENGNAVLPARKLYRS